MLAQTIAAHSEQKQIDTPTSSTLFSTYILHWLKTVEKSVDSVTYFGYEHSATTQVAPYFDSLKITLENVNRKILQNFFDEKSVGGRLDGSTGGLSPRTLQHYKTVIKCALNLAVDEELIDANPFVNIKLPKVQPINYSWFSTEKLNKFLDAIRYEPLHPVILFAGFYGLRKSEALGLKWSEFNFDNGTFRIQHTVVDSQGHTIAKDTTKMQAVTANCR
jgi:integrase